MHLSFGHIYFKSHFFRASSLLRLKSFLKFQAAKTISQNPNRVWDHVSISSHVSQSVIRNKDWDMKQLEKQDLYKERRHQAFWQVIRRVIKFNLFIDEIWALPFYNLIFYYSATRYPILSRVQPCVLCHVDSSCYSDLIIDIDIGIIYTFQLNYLSSCQ